MKITELKPTELKLAQSKLPLIAVSPVMSIGTALNLLQNNRITSLPVFSHDSTQVVSIVNLFDILLYLLVDQERVEKDKFRLDDPIENVLGLDTDRESYRMHKTDSQDVLLETLRAFASGVHRSLVIYYDSSQGPWLLSQTDIIRHIRNHPESIKDLLDTKATMAQLGFDKRSSLVTVSHDQSALSGYRLLAEKRLGGVPIVDRDGNLIGDLCLEDLPRANLEDAEELMLPSIEYVKHRSTGASLPVAMPDTSVGEILDIMVEQDTHRVWIKQNEQSSKVTGVISMSDIIGLLCH